jgi:hypothetical protein
VALRRRALARPPIIVGRLAEPTTLPDAFQAKRSSAGFQTIVSNTIAAPAAINMVVRSDTAQSLGAPRPGETGLAPDREIAEIVD